MTADEADRIIAVLRTKMCGPCRRNDAIDPHPACAEARELIDVVEREQSGKPS